jgi:hypothetical protein
MAEHVGDDVAKRLTRRSDPQVEFEKILSRLGGSSETIKEVERTIEAPDQRTKVSYSVEVDKRTGRQRVIEKFSTTMQQCHICQNYFPKLFTCEVPGCGALVCANDKRMTGWYFKDFEARSVCLPCYESAQKMTHYRPRT